MEQKKKNTNSSKDNKGCAIAVSIFVLVNIVYAFLTWSKEDIASNGAFFFLIISLACAFLAIKLFRDYTKNCDNKFVRTGIPIGIFVAFMLLYGTLSDNFYAMLVVGAIGFVVFCILLGLWIYYSNKD